MMFFAIFALLAVPGVWAYDQAWEDYKLEFNKQYTTEEEEAVRYANWRKNTEEVHLHNAIYGHQYKQAVNALSDLTDEEYEQIYLSEMRVPEGPSNATIYVPSNSTIPDAVDWRQQGAVTHVKNQGRCGSCYVCSGIGSLEGMVWKKKSRNLIALSDQQVIDCNGRGCRGGEVIDNVYEYIKETGGIQGESSYPNKPGPAGQCKFNQKEVVSTVSGYHIIRKGSEDDLTNAIARVGPISVCFDGRGPFRYYRSGVYFSNKCVRKELRFNHAATAVGYGSENGRDYYLVKNSWGRSFGARGYIKMSRNRNNNCGIATYATYPIV